MSETYMYLHTYIIVGIISTYKHVNIKWKRDQQIAATSIALDGDIHMYISIVADTYIRQ